jgi:glycine/D-amino acid oxidase-like deaminating enzyme
MLTLKQSSVGTILIGGGWPAVIDDQGRPQVSPESLSRNLAVALDAVPALATINIVRTWAAIVNGTDDWRPMLGELPGLPGFYINYVPWMGFTGGPGGARAVASMVQGKPAPFEFDASYFSP